MFFVLFVLHDETKLSELLDAWDGVGVGGITVLPSTGMGRISKFAALREDLPLIPSLAALLAEHDELLNRTLFTIVHDQALVDRLVSATERVVGGLDQENTGILAVMPIAQVYGMRKPTN
jgi:nitrogen regulatory protein PII